MEIYVLTIKKEGSDLVNVCAFTSREKAIDLVNVCAFTSREKAIDFAMNHVFELYNYGNEIDAQTRARVERVFRDEMKSRNAATKNKRVYAITSTKLG